MITEATVMPTATFAGRVDAGDDPVVMWQLLQLQAAVPARALGVAGRADVGWAAHDDEAASEQDVDAIVAQAPPLLAAYHRPDRHRGCYDRWAGARSLRPCVTSQQPRRPMFHHGTKEHSMEHSIAMRDESAASQADVPPWYEGAFDGPFDGPFDGTVDGPFDGTFDGHA